MDDKFLVLLALEKLHVKSVILYNINVCSLFLTSTPRAQYKIFSG